MIRNSMVILIGALLLLSCSKTFDTTKEMQDYIAEESNGYSYKKTVNGVDYCLKYRPTDLMVSQELGQKLTEVQLVKTRDKYSRYLYFNLSMSINNQELLNSVARDKAKFGQMVNDLAFGMDQKVHLYTPEKDTLAMADFIYPRMYGMSNSTSIMIVYPRDRKYLDSRYLNFVVEDLGLDTGDIKFKIDPNALLKEPQLRFQE